MEAYAVIETGGKQYRVQKNDVVEVELLDGVGLGDADFDGGGGLPGLFDFTLALPTDRLALRAEGDVDAEDVVLVAPDGSLVASDIFQETIVRLDAAGHQTLIADAAKLMLGAAA